MKLLVLFMLISFSSIGQKIGNLSIDSITFQKYIVDCYKHPDTLKAKSFTDFGCCSNCAQLSSEADRCREKADQYNDQLEKNSINGQIYKTIYYKAYYDTIYCDGIRWSYPKMDNSKREIDSIILIPKGSYVVGTGKYLVPRKPTESDFIKWFAKQIFK